MVSRYQWLKMAGCEEAFQDRGMKKTEAKVELLVAFCYKARLDSKRTGFALLFCVTVVP